MHFQEVGVGKAAVKMVIYKLYSMIVAHPRHRFYYICPPFESRSTLKRKNVPKISIYKYAVGTGRRLRPPYKYLTAAAATTKYYDVESFGNAEQIKIRK